MYEAMSMRKAKRTWAGQKANKLALTTALKT